MKITIQKFKTVENLTVSVPSEIRGGNGCGKTTILEAISFCLTGKDLGGNDFKQVYDSRDEIHDCIADVSFVDAYGNEYRRIVSPSFQITRAGIEELKIKRSTRCKKNGIDCNDFADYFEDFFKFGTDFFFNQKEDIQRSIFIDVLKSRMPDFDVKGASLKLKELKKAQKNGVDDVKQKNAALKEVVDIEVIPIAHILIAKNDEFAKIASVDNSALLSGINSRNNSAMSAHADHESKLRGQIYGFENEKQVADFGVESIPPRIKELECREFEFKELESTTEDEKKLTELTAKFNPLKYYDSIADYAADFFALNPVLVDNASKIKEITARIFIAPNDISGSCPLSGEFCETAKTHSVEASKHIFEKENIRHISELKSENREILQKEMGEANREYQSCKYDLDTISDRIEKTKNRNSEIEKANTMQAASFKKNKADEIARLNSKLAEAIAKSDEFASKIEAAKLELAQLPKPIFEALPLSFEIPEELKSAHLQYEAENERVIGQKAINRNNVIIRDRLSAEISRLQTHLFEVGEEIAKLSGEISDFFSNLKDVVKKEFSGNINIDVELLEYVMSRDEYKDCFKITANGNVFPFECNGALQNNLKMQILSTFQKIIGYKGITIMDNCEANTTQPINTCGMNCVLSFATEDEKLIIK